MRQELLDILICPACLPQERPLALSGARCGAGEILAGTLECPGCGRGYPVEEGLAVLLPEPPAGVADKYRQQATVSAYLWSHFADLTGDPDASAAYSAWAGLLPGDGTLALDLGCAVGRMSFELAAGGGLAVGLDRSPELVRQARRLARDGFLDYPLFLEGVLSEPRRIELPPAWHRNLPEFLVADVLALPFATGAAATLCSLNLIDKLPRPRHHLVECDRVAAAEGARFLFSDPFSWSTECAPPEAWLGGTESGPYAGEGLANVRRILETECRTPWRVTATGSVDWTIRNHRNHFERIRSRYLRGER